MRSGLDVPRAVLCRSGSGRGEETPGELSTGSEDSGERPPEEAPRSPAPGPVLGNFARRKTPKVSMVFVGFVLSFFFSFFCHCVTLTAG